MKKFYFVTVLLLSLLLCSCGSDNSGTSKSTELSEKYSFYPDAVRNIQNEMEVSAEEADEIFLVLVEQCGVDKSFTVSKHKSGEYYTARVGYSSLSVYLKDNAVSEVFHKEGQLYPAVAADASGSEENSAPEGATDTEIVEMPEEDSATEETEMQPAAESNTEIVEEVPASEPNPADNASGQSNGESNFNTYNNTEQQNTAAQYVLNTNTLKIHYPDCNSVPKIAPDNYGTSDLTVEELQAQGYTTCGNCFK